jgi:energy-coupling factor transporter ATP-binding protein EcfA2
MRVSRIRLTRIIAFNWYGFRTIIDVNGLTLLCGETGTGKSALLDLIQFVMSANAAKFNKAAAGETNARSLRGYCLCDTNTRLNDGNPRYLRRSGATIAALEFSWPAATGEEPRRETWGIRVQFDSPTAQPSYVHFYVSGRMERADFCDAKGALLSEELFRAQINNDREGDAKFTTHKAFQEEMGVSRHLYFDEEQMRKTLPKAIAFELDFDYQNFIRQFILEPAPPDVANTRRSLSALREAETRVSQLHDHQQRLERIAAANLEYQTAMRESAIFGHLRIALTQEEAKEKHDKAKDALAALRKEHVENQRRLEEATQARSIAQGKFDRVVLIAGKEDPNFSTFESDARREADLANTLKQLAAQSQTIRAFLNERAKAWEQWLSDAETLGLKIGVELANVRVLRDPDLTKAMDGVEPLIKGFNQVWIDYQTRQRESSEEIKKLSDKQQRLKVQLDELKKGRTAPTPLLDALATESISARTLGRVVEVSPQGEPWWGIIETLLGEDRNAALVETKADYSRAREHWVKLPNAEPLIHPDDIPERTPGPNNLATFLETQHPVARRYLDWRLGHIMAVRDAAGLMKHSHAATPYGDVNESPVIRHLAPEKEYTLGEEGLRRLHAAKTVEHVAVTKEHTQREDEYKRINIWLNSGQDERLNQNDTPESDVDMRNLPKVRGELEQVRSTLILLKTPEREKRLEQLHAFQNEVTAATEEFGTLKGPISQFQIKESQSVDAVKLASDELQTAETNLKISRAKLPLDISDTKIDEYLQTALTTAMSWSQRRTQAETVQGIWRDKATKAKELRQKERSEFLSVHRDEFIDFDLDDDDNYKFDHRLKEIQEHEAGKYKSLAADRRSDWEKRLKEDVLDQLREHLKAAKETVSDFNTILRRGIGAYRYFISQKRASVHRALWKLIEQSDDGFQAGDPLQDLQLQAEIEAAKNELMQAIDHPEDKNTAGLLDYRNYSNYDLYMLPADQESDDSEGKISLQQNGANLSGGEGQAPFFVAMLVAFHRVYDRGQRGEQSNLGLVVMDEAFSKLSAGHIADCLALAEKFGHQLILAFPMDRLGTMVHHADSIIQCRIERTADSKGGAPTSIINDVIYWEREEAIAKLL